MPVYHRFFEAGHLQFITASIYRRVRVFSHPEYCALFVNAVHEARAKFSFLLVGWVLMPEHFHLLLQPSPAGHRRYSVRLTRQHVIPNKTLAIMKSLQGGLRPQP